MKPDIQAYIDAKFDILRQELLDELASVKIRANIDLDSMDQVIDNKVNKYIKNKK